LSDRADPTAAPADEGVDRRVQKLVQRLTLEPLDRDLFLGEPGPGEGRLFGGMVAAQSLVAGYRTVAEPTESHVHSLHAYFLRPGRYDAPIRFVVDRIRDGRTFTTRRVVAHQGGEAIFNMAASFAKPEEGLSHQFPMPEAPDPEGLPTWREMRAMIREEELPDYDHSPVDSRVAQPEDYTPDAKPGRQRMIWMKLRSRLPTDDPVVHAGALAYASDHTLLGTALRANGILPGSDGYMGASLDHAMWFHRPPRFDDWLLYVSASDVSQAARGLIMGALFTRDGVQVASVAQEGLIRTTRR
jgi:acyl-CoA thioesterase-2